MNPNDDTVAARSARRGRRRARFRGRRRHDHRGQAPRARRPRRGHRSGRRARPRTAHGGRRTTPRFVRRARTASGSAIGRLDRHRPPAAARPQAARAADLAGTRAAARDASARPTARSRRPTSSCANPGRAVVVTDLRSTNGIDRGDPRIAGRAPCWRGIRRRHPRDAHRSGRRQPDRGARCPPGSEGVVMTHLGTDETRTFALPRSTGASDSPWPGRRSQRHRTPPRRERGQRHRRAAGVRRRRRHGRPRRRRQGQRRRRRAPAPSSGSRRRGRAMTSSGLLVSAADDIDALAEDIPIGVGTTVTGAVLDLSTARAGLRGLQHRRQPGVPLRAQRAHRRSRSITRSCRSWWMPASSARRGCRAPPGEQRDHPRARLPRRAATRLSGGCPRAPGCGC